MVFLGNLDEKYTDLVYKIVDRRERGREGERIHLVIFNEEMK